VQTGRLIQLNVTRQEMLGYILNLLDIQIIVNVCMFRFQLITSQLHLDLK